MSSILKIQDLIIIGGSSRNVGKTTLATILISRYAAFMNVTGLKVTSIRAGEERLHGSHDEFNIKQYRISRETDARTTKDTSAMLRAGARDVFYIESPDHLLKEAMEDFLRTHYTAGPLVCESRSLYKAVVPDLFVLLKHFETERIKPGFDAIEPLAGLVLTIDPAGDGIKRIAEHIEWLPGGWSVKTIEGMHDKSRQ